jgi:hypothetical protein
MSTSLRHAYGPLLAQVMQDKATYRRMVRMTLLLFAAELILLTLHGGPLGQAGKLVMVVLPWTLLQIWAGSLMRLAILQNRPEYAVLVPHLRGRLICMMAAWYTLDAVVMAVICGLAFGHAGYGLMFAGLAIVVMIFMNRYAKLAWLMAFVIPFSTPYFMNNVPSLLAQISETELTLAVVPMAALLGGWGLHLLLPRGGDRHWTWQYQFTQRQDMLSGKSTKVCTRQESTRLRQLLRRLYLATLRRDSQPGVAAHRAMMHVIGPGAHPGRVMAFSLTSTTLVLLIGYFASDAARAGMLTAICLMQLGAVLVYVFSVADDVVRHGAEQQLYLLTPAAPAAARINRLLIATLLRRALAVWLVSLGCAVLLDSALAGHAILRGTSFAAAMAMLWMLAPLMRNYALMPARRLGQAWTLLAFVVAMLFLVAVALQQIVPEMPWYEVGGVAGIGALVYLAVRWRALMALPPVLPAGRLAV